MLNEWEVGFRGRLKSSELYYRKNYNNAVVISGNILKVINAGAGVATCGCFIAVFDGELIACETHFPNGSIGRATGATINTSKHNQPMTEWVSYDHGVLHETFTPDLNNKLETPNALTPEMSKVKVKRTRLQPGDKVSILGRFRLKRTQVEIAEEFGISQAKVSLLKKEFIKQGKL